MELMETWIFLYFHLDRLGTQRNGTEIWFSIHHLNIVISSLDIYSYPVPRSAP